MWVGSGEYDKENMPALTSRVRKMQNGRDAHLEVAVVP